MKYILASASPRRKELLSRTGIDFTIQVSDCDEKITAQSPSLICQELAWQKANDVYQKTNPNNREDLIVIGADTIVVYQDEILGKPKDETDAYNMLSMLADRTHQVYTGVALIICQNGQKKETVFFEKTDVTFYPVDRFDLERYIKTKDPMDKAGAYGIQGDFSIHVKEIHGDYNNVVGLPIGHLYQELLPYINI